MIQQLLILALFLVALGYLGWRAFQTLSPKRGGCGKGCGCADTRPLASSHDK